MSGNTTRKMIDAYVQLGVVMGVVTRFLTGMFQTSPRNFYNSEEVELDIKRSGQDLAIVVTDLSTGYRMNSADAYTNKSFKAPVFKEAVPLNSFDLLKRMPGQNPFQDPGFRQNVILKMFDAMLGIEEKIRRSIELQASQVLQTGTITLSDASGTALYTIDFQPKTTHFPTVTISWGESSDDILGDLKSLAKVIYRDGLQKPDQLIFGEDALEDFLSDDTVIARLDNRRMDLGMIEAPTMRGEGGTYHGRISIGTDKFDIWSYEGFYINPATGSNTPYITADKVIMKSSKARLDATFGAIPNIGQLLNATNPVRIPELPGRFSNAAGGMDLHTNVWLTPDGEQLYGGIAARPLLIPTAIDTYGCLTTTAAT